MGLADLDELVLSCRDEEARGYISEAVNCYRAGAFRACIVSTWIAVVFDLISKTRELALAGDSNAQAIVSDLAAWQPHIERGDMATIRASLELERDIVSIANEKFGFFDGLQVLDLMRLRDDRNRCAHPTFQGSERPYLPSSELARAHLAHAVRHVLAQPPVQGKAAAVHIIRAVTSALFPTDMEPAKVQLRSLGLERPRDNLVRAVADQLVFGMFEGGPDLKARQPTGAALGALYELHPGASESRIRRALNIICRRVPDTDIPLFIGIHHFLPQIWSFLEVDNQQKLIELVHQLTDERAKIILPFALKITGLVAACESRLSTLNYPELGEVMKINAHPAAIGRAVNLYCASGSWDQANAVYDKTIQLTLNVLTEAQIRRILAAPTAEGADLHGAHSYSNFCQYIFDNEKIPRTEIIESLNGQGIRYLVRRLQAGKQTQSDDIPL